MSFYVKILYIFHYKEFSKIKKIIFPNGKIIFFIIIAIINVVMLNILDDIHLAT